MIAVSFARLRGRVASTAVCGLLTLVPTWGVPAHAVSEGSKATSEADAANAAARAVPPARWVNTPVKPFPRADDDSLTRLLATHRGQPILINFWATWCPPCRDELPALHHFAATARERGLTVITVAVADQKKAVEDLLWEIDVTLPVVHDPYQSISRAFGAYGLPTSYLLDRKHRVRYRAVGVVNWTDPATLQAIDRVTR